MPASQIFLVALDGSEVSERAAEFAASRARQLEAKLVLVHVIDWSGFEHLTLEEAAERHIQKEKEIKAAEEQILEPMKARLASEDLLLDVEARHGHPVETIVELAKEHGAHQVFVGRRGMGKLKALLLGSTTAGLAQVCPIPLTIVP